MRGTSKKTPWWKVVKKSKPRKNRRLPKIARQVAAKAKEAVEVVEVAAEKITAEVHETIEAVEEVVDHVEEVVDLASMTVTQLKDLCKERGLTGYSGLKKADLVDLLS